MTSKTVDGVTTTYTYDNADQLLSESRSGFAASYTYDANGNRLTKTLNGITDTYTYDSADKLTSVSLGSGGSKSFGYDAAGRATSVTTSAGTTNVAYDYEGRVTQITYPNLATNTFTYNGLSARTSKTDSSGTSTFRRDGAQVTSPVIYDGTANYTPGISERRSGATQFVHGDHLGSTKALTASAQSITDTRQYDAFGLLVASSGTTATPFGFAGAHGYQEDAESGLKLLGHRYYDPSIGRFLSRDSAKQGRNWYTYCDNSPIVRQDANGQWWETAFDIAMLVKGVKDFIDEPTWQNGLGVGADVVFLIAPVPNVAAVRHLDDVVDAGRALDNAVDAGRGIPPMKEPPFTPPSRGPSECFVAGTLIVMADGSSKPIEEVKPGDVVRSRSSRGDEHGAVQAKVVTDTFVRRKQGTLVLKLEDGQTVETTDEHPFYVPEKGFVPAESLTTDDSIAEAGNETTRILAIVRLTTERTVYNFEVEGTHTYFVRAGDDDLWVHNQCAWPVNQVQKDIERGNAPPTIDRADRGHNDNMPDHVHNKTGGASGADGSGHDGGWGYDPTGPEKEWFDKIGWPHPVWPW